MNAQQLIDTVLQLQQREAQMTTQMEAMTQQLQQQTQQIQQQTQQLQQQGAASQQQEAQLQAQVQQLQQQLQNGGNIANLQTTMETAFNALAQSQQNLVTTLKSSSDKRVTLIDTRGLAKPEKFDGREESFLFWRTRVETFVTSVYPEMESVLQWAEEEDSEITSATLLAAFGPLNPTHKTVDDIEAIGTQLYGVLQALCDREAFSIIRSSGKGQGFEAQDGTRHILDDEIKISTVEHLCPNELERHLQLNRAKYTNYSDVREEIITYLESRLGNKLKVVDPSGAAPMDLDALGKNGAKGKKGSKGGAKGGKGQQKGSAGKGKGTGNGSKGNAGKETRKCNNCGKVGHLQKDCWSAGGGAANKNQKPKGKDKGKGKGSKKGISNLEGEPEAENETAETGFLSIAMLEAVEGSEPEFEDFMDGGKFTMVRPKEERCSDPCDACLLNPCGLDGSTRHRQHLCPDCEREQGRAVKASTKKGASKTAIREELKWRAPEAFHYVVDKTICLTKGWTLGSFSQLAAVKMEELRNKFDPGRLSRDKNAETLRELESKREEERIAYFEKKMGNMLSGTDRTLGSESVPMATSAEQGTSRASGSADLPLPSRPVGTSASTIMHRTVEMMEITNLDAEKREKVIELETVEDPEEYAAIEERIKQIDERKNLLKAKMREDDKETKEKMNQKKPFALTAETLLDQSWHDARYHAAVRAGVSHSAAWAQEKKRRKATLDRKTGVAERRKERIRLDNEWHAAFDQPDTVRDDEFVTDEVEGIETEAVVADDPEKLRLLKGTSHHVRHHEAQKEDKGKLLKSVRKYRSLTQEEVGQFKQETHEDEIRVMKRARVDIKKTRKRTMTAEKKVQRTFRVRQARKAQRQAEGAFYLNYPQGEQMCLHFKKSFCRKGAECDLVHSDVDREFGYIEERQRVRESSAKKIKLVEAKPEINSFEMETAMEEMNWKKLVVNFDTGAAITALPKRIVSEKDIHKAPNSNSYKTASGELLEDGGGAILKGYNEEWEGRSIEGRVVDVHRPLISGSAVTKKNLVILDGDKGWIIPGKSAISGVVREAFQGARDRHRKEAKNLTNMYVDKGIYMFDLLEEEVVEGRKPKALRSPVSPTAAEIEEHEMTGHTIHRTWCGHCMRARGLVEQHRKVSHEEKGIPTLGIDYFFFGEDEKGLTHLQCKDDHSGMYWASSVPAKGADPFATNFLLGILDETGYKRVILRSDNEPAVKALKSAVKAAASCEVVLEESKTGDSQSNGLAESAVKETKRQCRATKSSLEEKMGKEVKDTHPLWSWVARHGDFLMSRYRVGSDGRTPYERLKGRRWKRPMVCFGEKVWFRPLKSYVAGNSDLAAKLKVGRYVGTHGRNGDVLIMTPEGVWKGGSIKRVPLEQRWDDEDFEKLRGTPWNLRPRLAEDVDSLPVRIELPPAEGKLSPDPAVRDSGPRNLYVKRKDVEGHFTPGCPGCIAIQTGLPVRSHNSECRTAVEQRLKESEEGRARVELARKRKAGEGPDKEGGALEDVPDGEEEMHGPAAIGEPQAERVAPVERPPQSGRDRVDPVGRPGSVKRAGEGIDPTAKKSKPEEEEKAQGLKRPRDPEAEAREMRELMKAIGAEEKRQATLASKASGSSGSGKQTTKDIASILQQRIMTGASEAEVLDIGQLLMAMGGTKADVAEIYNPERFTSKANRFGLQPGFAIDLTLCKNAKGEHWDLSTSEDQKTLKQLLKTEEPLFLIGSPPCGPFSPLQNLNKNKRTEEQNQAILEEGRVHLKVAIDSYIEQHRNGRFFLHEHPKPSGSWDEEEVKRLAEMDGVYIVQSPMCRWDMTSEDAEARYAQVYPPKLVSAILRGIRQELRNRGELSSLSEKVAGPCPDEPGGSNEPTEEFVEHIESEQLIYDSVTGAVLDPVKVKEARAEEMAWVEKQELWTVVDEKLCWEETGRKPITLKWVDRNKGDQTKANYRSRLVVREVKKASQPLAEHESYSAMPPLEALKVLCSIMTSVKKSTRGKNYKMALIDISRAHFYGVAKRRVFCTLPEGHEQQGKCALLRKTMYATMDAANIWQQTYVELLESCGVKQCTAWPALFIDETRDLRFLVHGDDFVCLGDEDALAFLESKLKEKFEYRIDGLIGPDPSDGTSMNVLNRVLDFDKSTGTLTYEADPRHAEHIIKELKLEGCKPVSTPAEKQKQDEVAASEAMPQLSAEETTKFRSLTMRAAYLSTDRADISEAVKSLARHMQKPTEYSWGKLKRLGRYLAGHPRVVQEFKQQRKFSTVRVYCDSDHAGDLKTRKSTTGIVCMLGMHTVKHSSTLQSTVSLSSGESEFYALVKAGAAGLGLKAMLEEWKVPVELILYSDSSAARGIISRKGLGRTRHVQTRFLWVQERLQKKDFSVECVKSDRNVSDICTKPLSNDLCWKHMASMGQCCVGGRHVIAKRL
eukprot:Skav216940  [mRNA]  locus=scaffold3396:50058:57739:+ [translate_table: standard]